MTDAILIFTFSPIQPFIAEARRTSDLYAGSQILVKMARRAGLFLKDQGKLIYPTRLDADVPNRLVAKVPWEQVSDLAKKAESELLSAWKAEAADVERHFVQELHPAAGLNANDPLWKEIWERQRDHYWECYWAATRLKNGDYQSAYREANRALDAVKRTRAFGQSTEAGLKDTLGGRRSGLRVRKHDSREYWRAISHLERVFAARLRPDGRERLDMLGSVKRFGPTGRSDAGAKFPSTSTIAARPFIEQMRNYPDALAAYRGAIEDLFPPNRPHKVDKNNPDWPYDGDLFYREELTPERLKESYNFENPDVAKLKRAQEKLLELYSKDAIGGQPDKYYAILVFDGDDMGERVAVCLDANDPEEAHRTFSQKISNFAARVKDIVEDAEYAGTLVYAGGDDVLAFAPVSKAIPLVQKLAAVYEQEVPGATASAGIAIVHHQYPLGAALTAARQSERQAKSVPQKAALAVRVLKRSGAPSEVRSKWEAIGDNFEELVRHFEKKAISSRFGYDLLDSTYGLPEAGEIFQSELKRQIMRHRDKDLLSDESAKALVDRLDTWAGAFEPLMRQVPDSTEEGQFPTETLARWVLLARFIAQTGAEEGGE